MTTFGIVTDTLAVLRTANKKRQAVWPGAEHFDLTFRGCELAGESGELANILKKLERIRRGQNLAAVQAELLVEATDEVADVVIAADLIAMDLGINLRDAIREKFDATSRQMGLSIVFRDGEFLGPRTT